MEAASPDSLWPPTPIASLDDTLIGPGHRGTGIGPFAGRLMRPSGSRVAATIGMVAFMLLAGPVVVAAILPFFVGPSEEIHLPPNMTLQRFDADSSVVAAELDGPGETNAWVLRDHQVRRGLLGAPSPKPIAIAGDGHLACVSSGVVIVTASENGDFRASRLMGVRPSDLTPLWENPSLRYPGTNASDGSPILQHWQTNQGAYCLDAQTGALRWSLSGVNPAFSKSSAGRTLLRTGDAESPATICVNDTTGAVLWRAYGHPVMLGPATALIKSDRAYVMLDASTGGELWRMGDLRPAALTATMFAFFRDTDARSVVCVDPRTGTPLWRRPVRVPDFKVNRPAVVVSSGDVIFIAEEPTGSSPRVTGFDSANSIVFSEGLPSKTFRMLSDGKRLYVAVDRKNDRGFGRMVAGQSPDTILVYPLPEIARTETP